MGVITSRLELNSPAHANGGYPPIAAVPARVVEWTGQMTRAVGSYAAAPRIRTSSRIVRNSAFGAMPMVR